MQISRFQQTPSSNGSKFPSRVSPMSNNQNNPSTSFSLNNLPIGSNGHQQNSASKSSGIQQTYATRQQQPNFTTNNYVGAGGSKYQTRYASVSPDSKNKSAFSEKVQLLANQAKRRTNALNSNSSFTRISDKPPKDNSQIQPQNIPTNASCQRASSVNRYSLRTKYGTNKNAPAGYSISLLKDDPFFPGQEALKKSSSLRAGSSLKCPSAGSRVLDNSKYQHNYSINNTNYTNNSKSRNDAASGLTELLNQSYQNTMTCNLQNQMNASQEKIFQNRKSSAHQNSFLSMNNTGYNSSTPSTLNTQQNNQQINSQLFSYHLNPAYIDPSFTENNHPGDTAVSRSTYYCSGEDNSVGAMHCKENDISSGNYLQIHQINQEKQSFSNKKQPYPYPKQQSFQLQQQQQQNIPPNNSSLHRLQQISNQPLKVLHTYQNMPCDIKLDMAAIKVKSSNNHFEKHQQENQCEGNASLQKKGSGMINIPQFINAGASTFSSTAKPNFQSTNKLNNSFNMSKELSLVSNESSSNIEDMHYYAVDFQQNCKKWLSQIELQF